MSFIRQRYFATCRMVLLITAVNGWRPFKIKITNHEEYTYSAKCRASASMTDPGKYNLHEEFLADVRSLMMHAGIFYKSYNNGTYDMVLLNRTVDVCKLLKDKTYEPMIQVIIKMIENHLRYWFSSCPVKKGVYDLKNVELNTEKLPPIFPEKRGMIDAVVMYKQEKLFRIVVFFEIRKTFKGT